MYTPPYPARPALPLSPLKLLATARKNLIAIWPDNTFELESFSYKIFKRQVHVVTSPTRYGRSSWTAARNTSANPRSSAMPWRR